MQGPMHTGMGAIIAPFIIGLIAGQVLFGPENPWEFCIGSAALLWYETTVPTFDGFYPAY